MNDIKNFSKNKESKIANNLFSIIISQDEEQLNNLLNKYGKNYIANIIKSEHFKKHYQILSAFLHNKGSMKKFNSNMKKFFDELKNTLK